ncbi:adenylate/guanylate cyclase domain-containing protein, partial [bacterium]|nr:adenylate/guanylate cyclase domain-containing protein [bacterium]
MLGPDPIASLLEDLDTIAGVARAGVLTASQDELEAGETRPAAVLFLDVVGFTRLARQLASDQLARLIDRTFRIFELTAKAHGGYCDKVVGDAGLYVFLGDPGHPPACESALAAGLALVARARQVSETLKGAGVDLAVRVGVAFGEVTRQRVGGEGWQVTVMGA